MYQSDDDRPAQAQRVQWIILSECIKAVKVMNRNGEPSLWALLTSGPWVLSLLAGAVFWSCVVRLIYWLYETNKP